VTLPIEDALEGKYEILEKIGEGGIGAVYKVRHRLLDEIRVIKVLRPQVASREDHQERFLHEARMAIRLKHPNIAQLHDFSISEEGTAFIVMEFIDGIALDALLEASGPPSLDLTLEIARQSLRALAYLHSSDMVHRDVSPDNIMLTTAFDGSARVKLIDLGIAKNLAEESGLTQTGVFLGKVRYCSPEQFSGTEHQAAVLDSRSDLYSFGLLLYELLTGVYPFAGKTFAELAGCHLFQPPISFDESDPDGKVPAGLRAVVLKALEKDPDARHESAEEFSRQLEGFGDSNSSIEEELNRTVERKTSEIPHLKDYTRPGSTQDRLNAQFGLGKTTAPKAISTVREDRTTATPPSAARPGRPSALGLAMSKWKWAAGVGVAVLGLAAWWFASSTGGANQVGDTVEPRGPAIEVEQTERFTLPEQEVDDIVSKDIVLLPPPIEEETSKPEPARTLEKAPSQSPERPPAGGDGRLPPPLELRGGEQPPPRGGPPPRGPGPGGPPIVGRTIEIYKPGVGVVSPVLMRLAQTIYPDDKKPKTEMVVNLIVLVDEHGKVLTASVTSGGGFRRRYRGPAVETAKRSEFIPAMKDGVAGRMWTEMRIVFEAE